MPARINEHIDNGSSLGVRKPDAFHRLVEGLSSILGPSSNLGSADVNPDDLQSLMEAYVSKKSEWMRYALRDPSRTYIRNLVDRGNGKSNQVSVKAQDSPIHDHANAHCVMKVRSYPFQQLLLDAISSQHRCSEALLRKHYMTGRLKAMLPVKPSADCT